MEEILIEEYNYPLPDERIAKYPLAARDQSKLLVYRDGQVSEDRFCRVGEYLPVGSLLIYNNTRVIQARLEFHKTTSNHPTPPQGARIEIFCLEPLEPHDYQMSLGATEGCTWKCMIGNAKKWKSGALSLPVTLPSGEQVTLFAEKGQQTGNTFAVRFWWDTPASNLIISFAEILDAVGELPIPPYLNRKTEESDKTTYQTVYSRIKGSVAAPTAGLHFTDNVLNGLREKGIQTAEVTLHVGAGTFQPVKVADANHHTMHTEIIAVPKETIQIIIENLGHIVAVGTTSMRTLESLYFLGAQLHTTLHHSTPPVHYSIPQLAVAQFEPYTGEHTLTTKEALQAIVEYLDATQQTVLHAETQIMIKPGYEFRVVDQLITNFHQPKSTLLLLVSAFVGGDWHTIYDYALAHDFRFLSYGDSSILFRRNRAFTH
jgi:S-adenosylmethionine:tRNA ribosyltransferase-isomerase